MTDRNKADSRSDADRIMQRLGLELGIIYKSDPLQGGVHSGVFWISSPILLLSLGTQIPVQIKKCLIEIQSDQETRDMTLTLRVCLKNIHFNGIEICT